MKVPMIGDVVVVKKWVWDDWVGTRGFVDEVHYDDRLGGATVRVNGDWYRVRNDAVNTCRVIRTAGYVWPMIIMIIMLVAASMACLEASAIADDHVVTTSPAIVTIDENPAGAVYVIDDHPTLTPTLSLPGEGEGAQRSCAVVIAAESLHLRNGASANDLVLAWLKNGEVVRVIDRADSDWWRIERGGMVGFARSIYLEEKEC